MNERETRAFAREVAGASGTPWELVIIPGSCAVPRVCGRSYYWTTPGGTEVRYPNAYKRKAKSAELIYNHSTKRIEVGELWLAAARKFRRGVLPQMVTDMAINHENF